MSRYNRENPDEPIRHDWLTGGKRLPETERPCEEALTSSDRMCGGELDALVDELREIITNGRNGRPYDRERARIVSEKLASELRTPHIDRTEQLPLTAGVADTKNI